MRMKKMSKMINAKQFKRCNTYHSLLNFVVNCYGTCSRHTEKEKIIDYYIVSLKIFSLYNYELAQILRNLILMRKNQNKSFNPLIISKINPFSNNETYFIIH